MLTGKEDLLQALVEAFIMEKGTKEFYAQAAAKSGSSDAKRTFGELSQWETTHMNYIQSLYQSILDDREMDEFAAFSKKAEAPLAEGGIPVKDLAKKIKSYTITNEKDALQIALTIEATSHALYKNLAAKAQATEAKVIFEEMMAQETTHMDQLNAMKKNIARK